MIFSRRECTSSGVLHFIVMTKFIRFIVLGSGWLLLRVIFHPLTHAFSKVAITFATPHFVDFDLIYVNPYTMF